MLRTRVMPCLLVADGRLVKTVRFKNQAYIGDPVNAIKIYNSKEVDELIVLDIQASRQGTGPNYALVEEVASECFMPLTYGGGVDSVEHARRLFSLGVEKVAVNTAAAENPELISDLATEFGSQSVVVSIDVKRTIFGNYRVALKSGSRTTNRSPEHCAHLAEKLGAGEILLNSVDRDGTYSGYDLELIRSVSDNVHIPLIAVGGAGSVDDLVDGVREGGADAVAAGSLFVYQKQDLGVLINFPERQLLETKLLQGESYADVHPVSV